MHRSGTSAVAAALLEMGLSSGPDEALMNPDAANPEGYYEIQEIADLNDRILAHLRARWDAPPDLAIGWERDPALDPWVQRAKIACKENLPSERWLLKDPRVTVLLPLWRRVVLDRCAAVLVVRDPTAVAWSVTLRDGLPMTTGLALWAAYNCAALDGLAGLPVYVCDYDRLIAEPDASLTDLVRTLLEWGEVDPATGGIESAVGKIQPHLNRSTWRRDPGEIPLRSPEIERIVQQLRNLTGRHDAFAPPPVTAAPWQRALLNERRDGVAEIRDLEALRSSLDGRIGRLERDLSDARAAYLAERTSRKEVEGALRWTRGRLRRLESRRSVRALRAVRRIGRGRGDLDPE